MEINSRVHKSIEYNAIEQNLDQIKACLILGFPIAFGFIVYESFESDQVTTSGFVPMPKPNEKVLGGHAVAIVGYDDTKQFYDKKDYYNVRYILALNHTNEANLINKLLISSSKETYNKNSFNNKYINNGFEEHIKKASPI